MMTRPTLNGRQARTLTDATRDPFDWISGPHSHVSRKDRRRGVVLAVCIGIALGLLIVKGLA